MKKTTIVWILAILITLASAFYQRLTGPTHPARVNIVLDGQKYSQLFIRSHGGEGVALIVLKLPKKKALKAELHYRPFPGNADWIVLSMSYLNGEWTGQLPHQPEAGKLQYYVKVLKGNIPIFNNDNEPIVIRFKGAVPTWILIIHIFFMFSAMLMSNVSGLLVLANDEKQRIYGLITLILLFCGGMIMGPIVQKYAFGEFWTGIPKGWDLTDNKTLIAIAAWIIAVALNWKQKRPVWTFIAAFVTLLIFLIPHSMFGSTLNRDTGTVGQALIFLPFISWIHFKKTDLGK